MIYVRKWKSISVIMLAATMWLAFGSNHGQTRDKPEDILKATINGNTYEIKSSNGLERYSYDALNIEKCSLIWTQTHEARQPDQPILREWGETRVPLNLLDLNSLKVEKLKSAGFLVPLLAKGLRPVITGQQRTQWGDDPPAESIGVGATGTGFYFRDHEPAERVAVAIRTLAKACQAE